MANEEEKRQKLIGDLIVSGYCALTYTELTSLDKDEFYILIGAISETQRRKKLFSSKRDSK